MYIPLYSPHKLCNKDHHVLLSLGQSYDQALCKPVSAISKFLILPWPQTQYLT